MNLTLARLTYRLARFELLAFGGLILALVAVLVINAARVDLARPPADCLQPVEGGAYLPFCQQQLTIWQREQNYISWVFPMALTVVSVFVAFVAALFLGAPIVARELERGTTRLAWSLAESRIGWYLARIVPVLAVLALLTFIAGVALDRHAAAALTEADLSNSFSLYGFRGLLIASRSVFIFAVAVAVGTIMARVLPAILVTAVVVTIGLSGGEGVHRTVLRSEAIRIAADEVRPGDLLIDEQFQLADGSLLDFGFLQGLDPPHNADGTTSLPIIALVVLGERYRFVETRMALVLAGGSLGALALAAFVVSRRRPD